MDDKKIPDSEIEDWEKYLENSGQEVIAKEHIDSDEDEAQLVSIDLHNKTLDQSFELIKNTIAYAKKNNIPKIEIITGVGKSETRESGELFNQVPRWFEDGVFKSEVKGIVKDDGNKGKLVVKV